MLRAIPIVIIQIGNIFSTCHANTAIARGGKPPISAMPDIIDILLLIESLHDMSHLLAPIINHNNFIIRERLLKNTD